MKWKIFAIFICIFFLIPKNILAYDCVETNSGMSETDLDGISAACQAKITDSQNQQTTLIQAISTLNSKINLSQAQINHTQVQIVTLEKEVSVLDGVLTTVSDSMDQLETIYAARVRESYKQMRVTTLDLLFSSSSIGDYFNKVKYLDTIKTKDELILTELEKSKIDYNQRKNDKVQKQAEVEQLKTKLLAQKKSLLSQQNEKQKILVLTQNDEKKYQSLLTQANALVAAMRGFTTGATPLDNQTHCDGWGCYYSQRDSQWFSKTIGGSSEILGRVGCLITSTAMIVSHFGKNLTPADIAGSSDPFLFPTAFMNAGAWTINGVTVNRQSGLYKSSNVSLEQWRNEVSSIDAILNSGRPVIAGLNTGYGTHFIVLKSKNGDGYIMDDPYMENGYDKNFTDTYNTSQIFRFDKVTVN